MQIDRAGRLARQSGVLGGSAKAENRAADSDTCDQRGDAMRQNADPNSSPKSKQ